MRIPDDQLEDWFRLVVETPVPVLEPMEAKLALARWIVTRSYGADAATAAEEHFTRVVRRQEVPSDVPDVTVRVDGDPVFLPPVLKEVFGLPSTSEARRLVEQRGCQARGGGQP